MFSDLNFYKPVKVKRKQARNQEFFRAGKVSENNGTSINI